MPECRCRTIKGVHIPGCMGCAVYGHERCTCPKPVERRKDADARISALERRLLDLEKAFYGRRKSGLPLYLHGQEDHE